jgi:hypothetical protein
MGIYDNHAAAERAWQELHEVNHPGGRYSILSAESLRAEMEHLREGRFDDTEGHLHDQGMERKGRFDDTGGHLHDRNLERKGRFDDTEGHLHDRNLEPKGRFDTVESADTAADGDNIRSADELHHFLHQRGVEEQRARQYADHVLQGGAVLILR